MIESFYGKKLLVERRTNMQICTCINYDQNIDQNQKYRKPRQIYLQFNYKLLKVWKNMKSGKNTFLRGEDQWSVLRVVLVFIVYATIARDCT